MTRTSLGMTLGPVHFVLRVGFAAIVLLGISTSGLAQKSDSPSVLKYGDGKADGKKSIAGTGEAILFAMPEGVNKVRAIKIHGSRYGYPKAPDKDFEITFLTKDIDEILHTERVPYRTFRRGKSKWVRISLKEPVEVSPEFWVVLAFNAERTKGVYVSYDTSTGGEYSRVGLPTDEEFRETDFKGDWMVQAMLAK